jgi:hypothetical protein
MGRRPTEVGGKRTLEQRQDGVHRFLKELEKMASTKCKGKPEHAQS